jgi:hypothetical protein
MAAAADPMIDLTTQLAALAAANATLQGKFTNLQPGAQAPASASFARTPAFMGQMDFLNFRNKANLSIYTEGKSPVFEED